MKILSFLQSRICSGAIVLCVVLAACSRGGGGSEQKTDDADSSAVAETKPEKVLQRLPDTIHSSVSALRYAVETAEGAGEGRLCSLADMYAGAPGAFTFRKGAWRDASFGGRVEGRPDTIVVDWVFRTGFRGDWGGGTGWTGQPVFVEWPDSCVSSFKDAGLPLAGFGKKEIIAGGLDGHIYFINFETGRSSRDTLSVCNPVKGSVSLDPTMNGNLYVGDGIPEERPFGARVVDLRRHEVTDVFGEDPKAMRGWGAYDASALRVGQFLFRPAENGGIYKFAVDRGALRLHSVLRYTFQGVAPGIESSMAAYLNYGYVGDNHGNIICVNLDTMIPVWRYFLGDDTDATPVVQEEEGRPVLYVACEVDRTDGDSAVARLAKLDAVSGDEIWLHCSPARMAVEDDKHFDGGYYATPLPGGGDCAHLLFVSRVLNSDGQRDGVIAAIDRRTGREVYATPMRRYGWSSPVGFLNDDGEMYVFAADCWGYVYLIEGRTGKIIFSRRVGDNFESSPVVSGNSVVVGSRGDKIFKMSIL